MVVKLTFDTNCILIDGKDAKKKYYHQVLALEKLANRGLLQIFKTDVQDTEIGKCNDKANPPPKMIERLEKSAAFEEQIGIAVVGYSRVGHCRLAGPSDSEEYGRLRKIIPDVGDVMTIMTHRMHGNEFIITENSRHFKKISNIQVVDPRRIDPLLLETLDSEDKLRSYLSEIAGISK